MCLLANAGSHACIELSAVYGQPRQAGKLHKSLLSSGDSCKMLSGANHQELGRCAIKNVLWPALMQIREDACAPGERLLLEASPHHNMHEATQPGSDDQTSQTTASIATESEEGKLESQ